MRRILVMIATGAGIAYFLDPQQGKRRRHLVRDRTAALVRRTLARGERLARGVSAQAYGAGKKLAHRREAEKPRRNDATLAQKIMSEAFRNREVPKGSVNVNVENGIAVLRGEVERPEMIEDLEKRVRAVQGVVDVENLLHLPRTPPRMHEAHEENR